MGVSVINDPKNIKSINGSPYPSAKKALDCLCDKYRTKLKLLCQSFSVIDFSLLAVTVITYHLEFFRRTHHSFREGTYLDE